jgi:hypothetical protein
MWRTPTNLGQAWGSVNGADDQPERFGSPPKRFGSPPERLVHTTVTMRKRVPGRFVGNVQVCVMS